MGTGHWALEPTDGCWLLCSGGVEETIDSPPCYCLTVLTEDPPCFTSGNYSTGFPVDGGEQVCWLLPFNTRIENQQLVLENTFSEFGDPVTSVRTAGLDHVSFQQAGLATCMKFAELELISYEVNIQTGEPLFSELEWFFFGFPTFAVVWDGVAGTTKFRCRNYFPGQDLVEDIFDDVRVGVYRIEYERQSCLGFPPLFSDDRGWVRLYHNGIEVYERDITDQAQVGTLPIVCRTAITTDRTTNIFLTTTWQGYDPQNPSTVIARFDNYVHGFDDGKYEPPACNSQACDCDKEDFGQPGDCEGASYTESYDGYSWNFGDTPPCHLFSGGVSQFVPINEWYGGRLGNQLGHRALVLPQTILGNIFYGFDAAAALNATIDQRFLPVPDRNCLSFTEIDFVDWEIPPALIGSIKMSINRNDGSNMAVDFDFVAGTTQLRYGLLPFAFLPEMYDEILTGRWRLEVEWQGCADPGAVGQEGIWARWYLDGGLLHELEVVGPNTGDGSSSTGSCASGFIVSMGISAGTTDNQPLNPNPEFFFEFDNLNIDFADGVYEPPKCEFEVPISGVIEGGKWKLTDCPDPP